MKGSICHVEIPADNLGALQGFYGSLFEWDFEKIPGDMEYYNVKHGEEKPMGGMMTRVSPDQKPTFYVPQSPLRGKEVKNAGTPFLSRETRDSRTLRKKLLYGWR